MPEHAPGWYERGGERRYWDGRQWTHSASVPPPAAGPAPLPPGQVPPPGIPPPQGAPRYGGRPTGPGGAMLPRREPALPVIVSFLLPGVGSMMNGHIGAGVAFLSAYILGLVLVLCLGLFIVGLVGIPVMLVAWGWGMYHAYEGAAEYNRALGYPN